MKSCVFFFLFFSFFVILSEAKDLNLSTYYDYAERTIHDDDDEIIKNTTYKTHNYDLKFDQELSDELSYTISSHLENKDYLELDKKDSKSEKLAAAFFYEHDKINSFNFKANYKTKRLRDTPTDEYNNTKLSFDYTRKKDKNYRLKTDLSTNNYDYINSQTKDITKTAGKIEVLKYLNTAEIGSSYKLELADKNQTNKDKTKQEIKAWVSNDFNLRYLKEAKLKFITTERNTEDEEILDQDTDFKFNEYELTTKHDLNNDLNTTFKYDYMTKKYIALDNDYTRQSFFNKINYDLFNTKEMRTWLALETEYKEINYEKEKNDSYNKKYIRLEANHKLKKDYKTYCYLEENLYCYTNNLKDKNTKKLTLGIEKRLNSPPFQGGVRGGKNSNDLTLELTYNYTLTDYFHKNNNTRESVRLSLEWKV